MRIGFKVIFILLLLAVHNNGLAQNQYTPFKGAVHLGTGVSTIIDFNFDNSGFAIPFQLGIETFKFVNSRKYVAFGFSVTKRGTRYYEKEEYQNYTTKSWNRLTLLYLDLPLSYHSSVSWFSKHYAFLIFGLNNSFLLKYPTYNSALEVDDEYYRRYNISLFTGLSMQKHRNFRWSLVLNQSILSILKPEYKDEIQAINEDYGVRVFPIEIIVSCAFVFD